MYLPASPTLSPVGTTRLRYDLAEEPFMQHCVRAMNGRKIDSYPKKKGEPLITTPVEGLQEPTKEDSPADSL